MSCGNSFQQEKQEPWLNFNPGLALAGFRTTGPEVKSFSIFLCFNHMVFTELPESKRENNISIHIIWLKHSHLRFVQSSTFKFLCIHLFEKMLSGQTCK